MLSKLLQCDEDTHTLSKVHDTRPLQERNEVRQRPGQEASLAPPCSNLRSLGSKCTALKKVLVTLFGTFCAPAVIRLSRCDSTPGELCLLALPRYAPATVWMSAGFVRYWKKWNSCCGKRRHRFWIFDQNSTTASLKYSLDTASASRNIIHLLCYVAGVRTAVFVTVCAQIS